MHVQLPLLARACSEVAAPGGRGCFLRDEKQTW
jgi:hypothetical protein